MKKFLLIVALLVVTINSFAHTWEIRVNQNQNGSLTWYIQSYHSLSETACVTNANQSGLIINGVQYPIQGVFGGSIVPLSSTIFGVNTSCGTARNSYGVINTPFLGTTLNVAPYSNVACWANCNINANGNFTPPPPPICTSCPVTGWSNTMAASGNNNGTICSPNDDITTATINVNHLSCASITGDKQFRVIFDPTGANVAYGPFNYSAGIQTNVVINVPYGTSTSTQVQVIDDDFPCQLSNGLSIPGGVYLGEKETTPPVINCPSNISVGTDQQSCSAVVNYALPTYSDNCGIATIQQISGLPSGAAFPKGNTTNTFRVTDGSGNFVDCSFVVTVSDNVPPTALCKNIAVAIGAGLTASITVADINNGSFDNCGPVTVSISSGKTQFDCNDVGQSFPVTILVTDQQGITSSCTAQVTVTDPNSYCNQTPVAVCKAVTVFADANCQGTASATAFDGGSTDADAGDVLTFSVSPAGPYAVGTTNVTLTVTDSKGASSSCNTTITVVDNTAPVISGCPANILVTTGAGRTTCDQVATWTAPTATDNCGAVSVSSNNNSGDVFPVGTTTVIYTFTDASGNASSCSFTVTVADNTPPMITAPANISVNNDNGVCSAVVSLGVPVTADNCGVAATTNDHASTTYPVGTTTVTWTVTDINGNSATATQTVTVTDNEFPKANCKPVTVTLVNGGASITVASVDNNSTDNCGITSMTISKSTFDCSNIGTNNVVLTVTDAKGNVSTCTAVVTVVGEIPTCSIASIPSNTTFTGGVSTNLYLGYGAQSTTLAVTAPASGAPYTYAWSGPVALSGAAPVFTPVTAGQYTFTVVTTNKYGCTTSCSITICVTDIRVPGSDGKKVFVCHVPPGNPANANTLSISVNAVPAHLGNHAGDRLGSCDQKPCGGVVVNAITQAATSQATKETPIATTEESFTVNVAPNPSANYFTLKLVSKYATPVNLKVLDANGRVLDTKSGIGSNGSVQVGHNYSSGTYYAELIQGNTRKVVQLIKATR